MKTLQSMNSKQVSRRVFFSGGVAAGARLCWLRLTPTPMSGCPKLPFGMPRRRKTVVIAGLASFSRRRRNACSSRVRFRPTVPAGSGATRPLDRFAHDTGVNPPATEATTVAAAPVRNIQRVVVAGARILCRDLAAVWQSRFSRQDEVAGDFLVREAERPVLADNGARSSVGRTRLGRHAVFSPRNASARDVLPGPALNRSPATSRPTRSGHKIPVFSKYIDEALAETMRSAQDIDAASLNNVPSKRCKLLSRHFQLWSLALESLNCTEILHIHKLWRQCHEQFKAHTLDTNFAQNAFCGGRCGRLGILAGGG